MPEKTLTRKPGDPRPGDLLLDGSCQEMASFKYDAMVKLEDDKSNQWKWFDLDAKLTRIVKSLRAIHDRENMASFGRSPMNQTSTVETSPSPNVTAAEV